MEQNYIGAWREILGRVTQGFRVVQDTSPEWMVNPTTNRRLKLDLYYPDIGIAVRFVGLRKGSRSHRLSLQEEEQQTARDAARTELCQSHGISLVVIDVLSGIPRDTLRALSLALSDASRRLGKNRRQQAENVALLGQISQARSRLDAIMRQVRSETELQSFSELWKDRQYYDVQAPKGTSSDRSPSRRSYTVGAELFHVTFGAGVIREVRREEDDTFITIEFTDGCQRTFAASLVGDKLLSKL